MLKRVLREKYFVLGVAIGLIAAQPAPAFQDTSAKSLVVEVEKAQAALKDASVKIEGIEERIERDGATVAKLQEVFESGGDPEAIAAELSVVSQNLDAIEGAIADVGAELGVIRSSLERLTASTRRFKSKKLAGALKEAFALLEELEVRVGKNKENVASVRKAANELADAVSSSRAMKGSAQLSPMNESGIRAKIEFVDDGTTLKIRGKATGMDPAETYLSNIYDLGSSPSGPGACVPSIFDPEDPDFILPTMFVGFWEVDKFGNGELNAVNTNGGADFVPLDKIGTMSVRLFLAPPSEPGMPPETELVACGPRE